MLSVDLLLTDDLLEGEGNFLWLLFFARSLRGDASTTGVAAAAAAAVAAAADGDFASANRERDLDVILSTDTSGSRIAEVLNLR